MRLEPDVPGELFTGEEIETLATYGAWMAALMHGRIEPETEAQRHFVAVCQARAQPETDHEHLWTRFMKRKLWESENPDHAGLEDKVFAELGITGKGWGVYGHFR